MKFRLVEDLESDLKAAAAEKDKIKRDIANIFKGTDFQEKKNINGISYNATAGAVEASFYIDDAVSYNGYVYDGADYNLQVEGDIETAVDSAKNILDEYSNVVSSAVSAEDAVDEEEVIEEE